MLGGRGRCMLRQLPDIISPVGRAGAIVAGVPEAVHGAGDSFRRLRSPNSLDFCYWGEMLKTRNKRHARQAAHAAASLASIEVSITSLQNDDLLDLADIFRLQAKSPIAVMAAAEMNKRGIAL